MKHRILPSVTVGSVFLALLFAGCAEPPPPPSARTAPDYWPTKGWRTSTLEEQGMDSAMLADMMAGLRKRETAIDSVLIVRNGYLVLESYVHPYGPDVRHNIYSVTKSVTSALVGIAIEKGYIQDTSQTVLSYFPERTVSARDADKEAMTLEHFLTMTAGFECENSVEQGLRNLAQSEDWVQYVLDQPMVAKPGSRHVYCNEAAFLLTAVLQKATGTTALEFAQQHLFAPLGVSDVTWTANPDGINIGASEMYMLPADMAKFGLLYLQQGRWDGVQVVPAAWVETSTRQHVMAENWRNTGYGYLWYVNRPGLLARSGISDYVYVFDARGFGGQLIFVVPEKNMVVVFSSWLQGDDFYIPFDLLYEKILPSVKAPAPLDPNPEAVALLKSHVQELAHPQGLDPAPPLPEKALEISGTTYEMDENRFEWKDFSLLFQEKEAEFGQHLRDRPWTCRVGMDGVFRVRTMSSGRTVACRGRWSDDSTFLLEWIRLGEAQRYWITFSFKDDEVKVRFEGSVSGEMPPMTGRRKKT